ncbi:MAG TPA: galactose-1-phosphate uridylyltransferase [Actinobacteria bacterium]|nr:galactose-1-phosphate uridylyltransferase [Actinomycetota bacterium]
MPELRQDPVTGYWAVIATERAKRPESFTQERKESVKSNAVCPFCYGNEAMTPPEVLAFRPDGGEPNTSHWKVRVVLNKFPAFTIEDKIKTSASNMLYGKQKKSEIYANMPGLGIHEVIISGPDHSKSLALLNVDEVELIIEAYRSRLLKIKDDQRIKHVLIIVNHGKEAGASLEHPHSQLFGTTLIPRLVADELDCSRRYFCEKGHCIFCDIIEEETKLGDRVIKESEHFLVFSPYASRQPFETWIVPKNHSANFECISSAEKRDLAFMLKDTLLKIYEGLNDSPYNYYLHTSPYRINSGEFYHWHIEIFPKLAIQAGFEMGSGMMINVVLPEGSARFLKNL